MVAYVIGHVTVKDPAKWAEYQGKVPATLAPWGAALLLRGTRIAVLSGEHRHTDTVVLRFPDPASVSGWYGSPAYGALKTLRAEAAEVDLVSFESTG